PGSNMPAAAAFGIDLHMRPDPKALETRRAIVVVGGRRSQEGNVLHCGTALDGIEALEVGSHPHGPGRLVYAWSVPAGVPHMRHAVPPHGDKQMNDEILNMSIRKFLKTIGVNSQLAIEKAAREAAEAGTLKGGKL